MHSTLSQGAKEGRTCPLIGHGDCEGPKETGSNILTTIANLGEGNGTIKTLPRLIEKVLDENEDVMPDELPKTLSPRYEVDHKIDLEVGAKPLAHAPYRMAPPEL